MRLAKECTPVCYQPEEIELVLTWTHTPGGLALTVLEGATQGSNGEKLSAVLPSCMTCGELQQTDKTFPGVRQRHLHLKWPIAL